MTLGNYEAIRQGGSGTLDDMSVVDRQSLANPDMSEKNTGTG
jgi:hypothetical protein